MPLSNPLYSGLLLVTIFSAGPATASSGFPGDATNTYERVGPRFRTNFRPIPGQYIVVLKDEHLVPASGTVRAMAEDLLGPLASRVQFHWEHALRGFVASLSESDARRLSLHPAVAWVEEDGLVTISATQQNATWGLDRIDQQAQPLDGTFNYDLDGSGLNEANVYVIDTGIRVSHAEFGGRAAGAYSVTSSTDDCQGHGTHVAGTIGGATYGVAKGARLWAVRVFSDCTNTTSYSNIIAGVNWVTQNHRAHSVANMSVAGPGSSALDTAVTNSISAGTVYVVAAGNDAANGTDACQMSPGRVGAALTVGATTSSDAIAYYSNQGSCVDIFAPGHAITSASNANDTGTVVMSGTSMAAPHVAGVAAVYRSAHPAVNQYTTVNAIIAAGTPGLLSGLTAGSPDLLLFSYFVSTCDAGAQCGTSCVDTQADTKNCGGCGITCGPDERYCVFGQCAACPIGFVSCCGGDYCRQNSCAGFNCP